MIYTKQIIFISLAILMLSCTREPQRIALTDPGFGITATTIHSRDEGEDVPILLKSDDIIKGIQFTLVWDASIGQVIKPALTSANPGFTISVNDSERGRIKVLVFSITGEEFNLADSSILSLPIRITNPDAEQFDLVFEDVIFAGPNATSYEIPVSHANLKIVGK